jgi:hypothetical protein
MAIGCAALLHCGGQLPTEGTDVVTESTPTGAEQLPLTLAPNTSYHSGDDFNGCGTLRNLNNPYVEAIQFYVTWSKVESTKGVYNWSCLDQWLAAIHNAKKKAVIVGIYLDAGLGTNPSSQKAPAWLWNELGPANYTTDAPYSYLVPNYWSPIFLSAWRSYIGAFGAHIAASPYRADLEYFRGMTGKGGELMYCKSGLNSACATALKSFSPHGKGATNQELVADWAAWVEARHADQKAAFNAQTWVVSNVDPWDGGTQVPGCTRGSSVLCSYRAEVVLHDAASGGIMIGDNGMSGTSSPSGTAAIAEYAAHHLPGPVLFAFQSVGGIGANPAEVRAQATAGYCFSESDDVAKGRVSFEWYAGDAANPVNQPTLDLFRQWEAGTATPPSCSGL